jgi:hypothetical protein
LTEAPPEDRIDAARQRIYVALRSALLDRIRRTPAFFERRMRRHVGVAWLGTRYPITTLPSVASFQALRERPVRLAAAKPFLSFGNSLRGGNGRIASHRDRAAQ